jgi:amino acid transporter/nucleotide-binding universal stress UspA family protein
VADSHELQRDLGFWSALTIGAGTMIGAGIFLLAGRAIELAGPGAMLSYLFAGVICMLTAAAAAELATGMPTSGGDYYFVSRSLGAALGAVSGVGIWLSLTVAIAFYLVGTGEFLAQVSPVPEVLGALGGAALLLVLNVVGAKVSGRAQIVIVIALLAILAVFVVGGFLEAEAVNLTPFLPEGGGAVLTTTALVFVSFLGFVKIAAVAEEVKDPARNLPRALIGSVALVTVLYVLIVLVVGGVFTQEAIREIPDPLTRTARLAFGEVGATGIIVAGLFATLSSANASILAASRINLAMSRDGLFPEPLAQINQRFVTPLRAIVLTSLLAAVLIVALPNVEELAKIASSLQLYSYAAINIGCVALRAADPEWYRPSFRVPLTPLPQIVGAIGCLVIIGFSGGTAQLAVLGLIAVSLGWYAVRRSGVDFETAVPELRARWQQLGLRVLFAPPSVHDAADAGQHVAPLERIVGTSSPRRVAVALANPSTESALLGLAVQLATGSDEPGQVLATTLVAVPRQTPLVSVGRDEGGQVGAARERVATTVRGRAAVGAGTSRPVDETVVTPVAAAAHDVADGLVSEALGHDADLLLLGWQGGFSLGRIADTPVRRVLLDLPADVAVLKDRDLGDVHRVLVPWGGGRHARLGLELAVRVAAATGARVDVLRAVREQVDHDDEAAAVRADVAPLLAGTDVDLDVLVVDTDDVARTITETAAAGGHDLVVIGASGESGLRSVLFGSIPDVVADAAPCSVLLVQRYVPAHWAYRTSDRLKRLRERAGLSSSAE